MKIKIPLELNYPADIDKFFYYYFKVPYFEYRNDTIGSMQRLNKMLIIPSYSWISRR